MPHSRKVAKNEDEMFALAASFVRELKSKNYELKAATVVGLSGELGAGKTTFVKGVARALGVRGAVTSPTFVIMKIYKLSQKPWEHLIHIDAYRLESAAELRALGWDDIAADPGNLILIEWAERVRSLLPRGCHAISLKAMSQHVRHVALSYPRAVRER